MAFIPNYQFKEKYSVHGLIAVCIWSLPFTVNDQGELQWEKTGGVCISLLKIANKKLRGTVSPFSASYYVLGIIETLLLSRVHYREKALN